MLSPAPVVADSDVSYHVINAPGLDCASPMSIQLISAVTFFVADMARSCVFYRRLGFELKYGGETSEFSSFFAGASFVNLNAAEAPAPGGGLTIFHVDDVDAIYQRAITAGLSPDFPPEDAPWGERYFHLRDPDGYLLSFARPLP